MNKEYINIDLEVKQQLADYEGLPPGVDREPSPNWAQIEALLGEEEEKKSGFGWSWVAAAAVILLLAGFGLVRTVLSDPTADQSLFGQQTDTDEDWLTVIEEGAEQEGLIYQQGKKLVQKEELNILPDVVSMDTLMPPSPPPPPPSQKVTELSEKDFEKGPVILNGISTITDKSQTDHDGRQQLSAHYFLSDRKGKGEVFQPQNASANTQTLTFSSTRNGSVASGGQYDIYTTSKPNAATYSWSNAAEAGEFKQSQQTKTPSGAYSINLTDGTTSDLRANNETANGLFTGGGKVNLALNQEMGFVSGGVVGGDQNAIQDPGYFDLNGQTGERGWGDFLEKGGRDKELSGRFMDQQRFENYNTIIENAFLKPFDEPLSTFSIDVDHASYSNVRRIIREGYAPQPDAVRIEEMVNYFDYAYKAPPADGEVPFNLISEISDCPWTANHKLVHIGLQGRKIDTEDLPASNLVFLVDVSGSMSSTDKLPLLKESFALLVEELRPQDKVSLVVYAGAAGVVLKPTAGNKKEKIMKAMDALESGGSTAGGEGIELAYKLARENFMEDGNNRVILATDGDFNVGISSDEGLEKLIEKRRKDGVFLSILGFGTGNYQDGKMQTLADKGNGNHYYIDNLMEAKKTLVNEFGGTLYAIAKDVKIQVEFNPALVESYRLIGYENRMLAAEDFDNDAIDAGELGAGHTVTAMYEIVPVANDLSKDEAGLLSAEAKDSHQWLTLKLRYKDPNGEKSKLIRKPLRESHKPLQKTSDNYRWSAAVAGFGLLLRNSQYKGQANYPMVLKLAEGAQGPDVEGYRAEFIKLVKSMEVLDNMQAVQEEYRKIWGN